MTPARIALSPRQLDRAAGVLLAAACGDALGVLRTEDALDQIATGFLDWAAQGATDMGTQTRAVLTAALQNPKARPAAALREAARALHERTGRTAGNGSLMRTAPVALAFLDDQAAMAEAARAVSDLTHPDPLAGTPACCGAPRSAARSCTAPRRVPPPG